MAVSKRNRTREKLLIAAQELLLEGGFSALGIQALTERADVALGTMYNYFRTREEVADAVVEILLAAFLQAMEHISKDLNDPAAIVSASIRQTLHWMTPQSDFGKILFISGLPIMRYAYQVRQGFIRDMQLGVEQGRFTVKQHAIIASMISGGVLAVLLDLFLGHMSASQIPDVAEQALLLLGINPIEAHQIANQPLVFLDCPDFPVSSLLYLPLLS